jgi:Uma2 family endonuclease
MTQPLEHPRRPPRSDELVCDDGEPMESARHHEQMIVLIDSLQHAWRDRDDFYVGGNMFFYFSETQARNNDFRGPDVFVAMDTTQRERRAWVVWEENGQVPDVIIELLSETTEHIDRGEKMRVYARLRVGEYFLFDPFSGVLEGYELDLPQSRYEAKRVDRNGRLRCRRLGLRLGRARSTIRGMEADWLRWFDATGSVLITSPEAARSSELQANAEAERANAEAERAARLEAEIAALKKPNR